MPSDPVCHNLPLPLPPLLGREREMAAVEGRLRAPATRLLTLTGVGGVGKTRLVLAVAEAALAQFPHGVWLVPLAALQDPTLLAGTVAQALGVREAGAGTLEEHLIEHLRDRQVLLVLDNCEHLRDACAALVAALLAACPCLRVLATSRAPLRLPDERRLAVPPLALPAEDAGSEAVAATPAAALFVARARAVEPAFALDAGNAAAVAHICRRLDGLPLALELAAARLKGRTPAALLDELGDRLRALGAGSRRHEARQRTLHALLDWSYTLLGAGEQALFARLSAFAGGWTAEAAATVCPIEDDLPFEVAEGLASLAEQSLVQGPDPAGRYSMLETVREYAGYALARLAAPEDGERARYQHAEYYLALAEEAEPALRGPEQASWLARLEAEHDNLRAVLTWAHERRESGVGLRLAGSLWRFWHVRGYLREGLSWLEGALAPHGDDTAPVARVGLAALTGAGVLATDLGRYDRATELFETRLALAETLGDQRAIAGALSNLGNVALYQGDYERAAALLRRSWVLRRTLGDKYGRATVLLNLGAVARYQGRRGRAALIYGASLLLFQEVKVSSSIARVRASQGNLARDQGDYAQAAALFRESLDRFWNMGDTWGIAECLAGLAGLACAQGQADRAARLYAVAATLRDTISSPMPPADRASFEHDLATIRAALGAEAFGLAWSSGSKMHPEQARAYACGECLSERWQPES